MDSVLSKPAVLASIAYLILAFAILIPLGVADRDATPKYNFGQRILLVLLLLIPIALSIYSINCMIVGGCHVWAWIQGIAIAFWVLLFVVASILSNDGNGYEEIVIMS
jgi:hypothetical protein